METTVTEQILCDYLERLERPSDALPPAQHSELVEEITDHIAAARAAGQLEDEASLRSLLDRLGDPADIVAAARADQPGGSYGPGTDHRAAQSPPLPPVKAPGIGLEIAAVMLMTVGSIIPFIGWLAGVVLLWTSRRLRTAEKILATLVVPGGPLTWLAFLGLFAAGGSACSTSTSQAAGGPARSSQSCTQSGVPPWLGITIIVVAVVVPFVIGAVLLRRASVRARLEVA